MSLTVSKEKLNKLQMEKKARNVVVAPAKKPVKEKTIDENVTATKELASAIKELAVVAASQSDASVKSDTNQRDMTQLNTVIDAMIKMNETQQSIRESLTTQQESEPKEWEFAVLRNKKGTISKILAKEV